MVYWSWVLGFWVCVSGFGSLVGWFLGGFVVLGCRFGLFSGLRGGLPGVLGFLWSWYNTGFSCGFRWMGFEVVLCLSGGLIWTRLLLCGFGSFGGMVVCVWWYGGGISDLGCFVGFVAVLGVSWGFVFMWGWYNTGFRGFGVWV